MKRILLSALLAVLLCIPLAQAQTSTITINDGTNTSGYVPVNGVNLDASYMHTQMLIPSDSLTTINGNAIFSVMFYLQTAGGASKNFSNNWTITLIETTSTSLSTSYEDVSSGTVVYTGLIDWKVTTPTITFDAPFVYNGGNLLIDMHYTNSGGGWNSLYFYGVSSTGMSIEAHDSSDPTTAYAQTHSPKMTFGYGAAPTCYQPTGVTASNVTANSADFSWTASGHGETQYQYLCIPATDTINWANAQTATTTSATVTGLNSATDYVFYVRSYCSATDQSMKSNTSFRTACGITAIPYTCGFEPSEGFTYSSSWVDGALEERCWSTLGMKPAGATYPYYYITNYLYLHSGSQGLRGIAGSGVYGYWILPEFAVPTDSLVMELWYRTEGTASNSPYVEIGYMTDPAFDSTFVMLQQLAKTTTMTKATQAFQGLSVPSTARIAVRFGGGTGDYFYCGIDDIKIIKCRATATPVIDSVYNITTTTADVAFSGSNATSYRIMAATKAVENPDTFTNWAIDTIVTASPATINVQPSTKYYLYVQGIGTDTSLVSNPTQFVTGCVTITTFPWTEDFDSEASGNFSMACWTNERISGSGTEIAIISTSELYYNTTPQLHFNYQDAGTRIHVLTPEFDIPATGTYNFSLDVFRQSNSSYPDEGIRVIVDNGAGKDTTFIPVDIASAGNVGTESGPGWYTYTVELHNSGIQQIEILDIDVDGYGVTMDNFRVYDPYDSVTVVATAQVSNTGTVEGAGRYLRGDEVTLTATPAEHYHFVQWVEDGETNPTRTFIASADTTYFTAQFDADSFNITGLSADSVMGTVSGSGRFPYNYTAQLTATANYGYHFTGWSNGDVTASTFITVTGDSTITANFAKNEYTVTLVADPDSMGTVTGDGTYEYLDTVMVVATPDSGYYFRGWSNGETADTLYIVLTSDTNLTATFSAAIPHTVSADVEGVGTVSGLGTFNEGETVTLIATAGQGYEFDGWSGDTTGIVIEDLSADTITFIVTRDVHLTATFTEISTSVGDVEASDYVAYTEGRRIVVAGVEGRTVSLFDATGRLVATRTSANETETFDTPLTGVYMIKVNSMNTTAIVVK